MSKSDNPRYCLVLHQKKHIREGKRWTARSPLAPIRSVYLQADTSATVMHTVRAPDQEDLRKQCYSR